MTKREIRKILSASIRVFNRLDPHKGYREWVAALPGPHGTCLYKHPLKKHAMTHKRNTIWTLCELLAESKPGKSTRAGRTRIIPKLKNSAPSAQTGK